MGSIPKLSPQILFSALALARRFIEQGGLLYELGGGLIFGDLRLFKVPSLGFGDSLPPPPPFPNRI